jgi:hypothetical protein
MKKLVRAEGKRHDRIGKVPRTRLGSGLIHSRRAELLPQKVANDRGPDKLSLEWWMSHDSAQYLHFLVFLVKRRLLFITLK